MRSTRARVRGHWWIARRPHTLRRMAEFSRLIPVDAPPEERSAILDELAAAHNDLKDIGIEPTCDIVCTPDGDLWHITWDEAVAA
jgi:hypothetical protein